MYNKRKLNLNFLANILEKTILFAKPNYSFKIKITYYNAFREGGIIMEENSRHTKVKEYTTIQEDLLKNQQKVDAIKKYNQNCSR